MSELTIEQESKKISCYVCMEDHTQVVDTCGIESHKVCLECRNNINKCPMCRAEISTCDKPSDDEDEDDDDDEDEDEDEDDELFELYYESQQLDPEEYYNRFADDLEEMASYIH